MSKIRLQLDYNLEIRDYIDALLQNYKLFNNKQFLSKKGVNLQVLYFNQTVIPFNYCAIQTYCIKRDTIKEIKQFFLRNITKSMIIYHSYNLLHEVNKIKAIIIIMKKCHKCFGDNNTFSDYMKLLSLSFMRNNLHVRSK